MDAEQRHLLHYIGAKNVMFQYMMVSFSGGKDSTVTSHLVNRALGTHIVSKSIAQQVDDVFTKLLFKKTFIEV